MVRRQIEKTSGLLISVIVIAITVFYSPDYAVVGISRGCKIIPRLLYSFVHVSTVHAMLNAWCLVSIMFLYDVSWRKLLLAYVIAVSLPNILLTATPTVGLSAICFALLGSITPQVKAKLYYSICMAAYIVCGFLIPQVNGLIHLYSYVAGLMVGLITMPIQCSKR